MQAEVIVVGAGHAGAEAALAAARRKCKTLLLTLDVNAACRMSCNPAIGGLAKGQIVREIDALGGEMGKAIDATAIQFRMLNTSKGPAVRSPRAQADKAAYSAYMRDVLCRHPFLEVIPDEAADLIVRNNRISGVIGATEIRYEAPAVILATGTFLRGLQHCGEERRVGGRIGEPSAERLSVALERLGFEIARLKTGTPPRLDRTTIDFSRTTVQHGDPDPKPFSHFTRRLDRPALPCWITATGPEGHDILRANLHRSPLFSGQIDSTGPRYCPSIEDKVVRFPDRDRHIVFLEPEGAEVDSIYCNGISTSMPADVQESLVRTIPGLEKARFLRHGYAIEYDYAPPHQIRATTETRLIEGLFFAGQLNGTSGYEEAAGQGLLAGINAVQKLKGLPPVVLERDRAYIGVLIDDLISMEHREPYRMFTSRAEFRLMLRTDNADRRLMPIGHGLGLIPDEAIRKLDAKESSIREAREELKRSRREALLRRPEMHAGDVFDPPLPPEVGEQVEIEVKYETYIRRHLAVIEETKRMEAKTIPEDFPYRSIGPLSNEAKTKLEKLRPETLGRAARIAGVSPADVQLLLVHLTRRSASPDTGARPAGEREC